MGEFYSNITPGRLQFLWHFVARTIQDFYELSTNQTTSQNIFHQQFDNQQKVFIFNIILYSKNQPPNQPREVMLKPVIPYGSHLGELKDLAQEVIAAAASLEGRVALETARALGDELRLVNSYYSNLIEGHKTFIPDIHRALDNNFSVDEEKRYAQELCAAHVRAEKKLMAEVTRGVIDNVSSANTLKQIHYTFYSYLPPEHQYAHDHTGFTDIAVQPGEFRDVEVAVHDDGSTHGPRHHDLASNLADFTEDYDPRQYHGDERLIAMAAAHHQLTWLHPFRDGNGRVSRLHSGLFLSFIKINRGNLWSLSRGLSRSKNEYMVNLFSVDPSPNQTEEERNEHLADFCDFFLKICLDQIQFMTDQLRLERIEQRIEYYARERSRRADDRKLHANASRLLRAVFMQGRVQRGEVPTILNMSPTSSRRIVRQLLAEGLLKTEGHKNPLQVALPMFVMPHYFPSLYQPDTLGSEYVEMLV